MPVRALKTKGGGNCFFHASFGDLHNDEYITDKANEMRQEWHRFLNQFDSLRDVRMPAALRSILENLFAMFLERPADLTGKADQIKGSVDETLQALELANFKAEELLINICDKFVKDVRFQAQIYQILQEDSIRAGKDLAAQSELINDQQGLKNRIRENLKECALRFDINLTEKQYNKVYDPNFIQYNFIESTELYKAYLDAIQSSIYYVFILEIPILAALSNTTIELHYRSKIEIYEPDIKLLNPEFNINDDLWGKKEKVIIHHQGIHYSHAINETLPTNKTKQNISEQPNLPSVKPIDNNQPAVDSRLLLASSKLNPGGLRHTLHGNLYQLGLLILIAQRAKQAGKKFVLISEADGFEKFDDLVVEYEDYITFLQAKHTIEEQGVYTVKNLCADESDDASLAKYFDSWCKLSKRYSGKPLQFIFFSNRGFTQEINDCMQPMALADDAFLFKDINGETKKFKEDHPLIMQFKTAILKYSTEIAKAKTLLRLNKNGYDNQAISKLVSFIIKKLKKKKVKANKQISIASLRSEDAKLKPIFLALLQLQDLPSDYLVNSKSIQCKLKDILFDDKPQVGIIGAVKDELNRQLKSGKNEACLKALLKEIVVKCPQNILDLETIQRVNKAEKVSEQHYECYKIDEDKGQKKGEKHKHAKISYEDSQIIWELESKQDNLLLLALFENEEIPLVDADSNSIVHKKILEDLLKIFNGHFSVVKKLKSSAKETDNSPLDVDEHDEKNIRQFFSEMIFKIAQPNRNVLAKVIQEELAINTRIASNELYQQLFQKVLDWFADHKCEVLEAKNFGDFMRCKEADLRRFYLLGETVNFKSNCSRHEILAEVLNTPELDIFLNAENSSQRIAIIYGEQHADKKLRVYRAISKLDELKDDNWAYLDTSSTNFVVLKEFLLGDTLELIVINILQPLAEQQNDLLREICREIVQSNKKLILLLDTEADVNQQALLQLIQDIYKNDDFINKNIIRIPANRLQEQELKTVSRNYQDKFILVGNCYYQIKDILSDTNNSIYNMMRYPQWLLDIFSASVAESEKKTFNLDLPYKLYIKNAIVDCVPCYDLYTLLQQSSVKIYYLFDVLDDFLSICQNWFEAKRVVLNLQKAIADTKYRIINKKLTRENWEALTSGTEKIIIQAEQSLDLDVFLQTPILTLQVLSENTKKLKVIILSNNPGKPADLPLPIDYLDPEQLQSKQLQFKENIKPRELLKIAGKPVIRLIAADAGKGKSSLFKYLLVKWRKSNKGGFEWLFKLSLPELEFPEVNLSFEELLLYLASKTEPQAWQVAALKYDIKRYKVKLLLDAWDEVKGDDKQKQINQFIASIPAEVSYDITTRPYAKTTLVLPKAPDHYLDLKTFDESQIKKYITNFFAAALKDKLEDKLISFVAEHIFGWLQRDFGKAISSFIGIPLQVYLFCEGLLPEIQYILHAKSQPTEEDFKILWQTQESMTGARLYQAFTFAKLLIFLKKHLEMDINTTLSKRHRVYAVSSIYMDFLMAKAYEQLFNKSLAFFSDCLRNINYTPEILEDMSDTGLIVLVPQEDGLIKYQFIHQTYQEYFAALFILKALLADEKSSLYQEVARDIWQNRYLQKYKVIFAFAAQLSIEGDPLLPGWAANRKIYTQHFWRLLCAEPEDVLGKAKALLFSYCLNALSNQQKEMLQQLLSIDLWDIISAFNNNADQQSSIEALDIDKMSLDGAQSTINAQAKFTYQLSSTSVANSKEDKLEDYDDNDIIEILKDKSKVHGWTKSFIESNPDNTKRLAPLFLQIISSKDINWYWDIDGGFAAIVLLGDAFNREHANYFIGRIKCDPAYRVSSAVTAINSLLTAELKDDSFEAVLLIILELINWPQHHKINHFVEQMLQVISPETFIKKIIFFLQKKPFYYWSNEKPAKFNDITEITSKINQVYTNIFKLFFLSAWFANYAVIFNESSASLLIFTENTQQQINFGLKQQSFFKSFIQTVFAEYKAIAPEKAESYFINNATQIQLVDSKDIFLHFFKEEEQQSILLKETFADKDLVKSACEWLSENDLMSKQIVNLLVEETKKHGPYWPIDGGIAAIAYAGKYFNADLAEFLIARAGTWPNNKLATIETLKTIGDTLNQLNENGYSDNDLAIAVKAYNDCIKNAKFSNAGLTLIVLKSSIEEKVDDAIRADSATNHPLAIGSSRTQLFATKTASQALYESSKNVLSINNPMK